MFYQPFLQNFYDNALKLLRLRYHVFLKLPDILVYYKARGFLKDFLILENVQI